MINAGKFNKKIIIYRESGGLDNEGFPIDDISTVLTAWANVKTTKGFTLISNNSDFEKAYTNFTIRYPKSVEITRDMLILFNDKSYSIEYLNNVNEDNTELEIQAKEITH